MPEHASCSVCGFCLCDGHDCPRPTTCRRCQTRIVRIGSPTGDWWTHYTHPGDGHEAEPAA